MLYIAGTFAPEKCAVYLKLLWIGLFPFSLNIKKTNKVNSQELFWNSVGKIVFSSTKMSLSFQKDVLPAHQRSNIVYKRSCHCDSVYVGRTSQRLAERIRQHVPKFIRNKDLPRRRRKSTQNTPIWDSGIGQHLLENKICAEKFDVNWFSILATERSSFHVATHAATFIESLKPSLYRQKECVYGLKFSC